MVRQNRWLGALVAIPVLSVCAMSVNADKLELANYHGAGASMTLNESNDGGSFSASSNMTVDQIHVYIGSPGNAFSFGIQADVAGAPSGVNLGFGTSAVGNLGWNTMTLNNPVALTANTRYYLINSGGNPASTSRAAWSGWGGSQTGTHSDDGSQETEAAFIWNGGFQPTGALIAGVSDSGTGDAAGMVYHSASFTGLSNGGWAGQRVTNNITTGWVNSITLRLNSSGSETDDVRAYLIDANTNAILDSGVIAASGAAGLANYTLNLVGTPLITLGSDYIIAVESLGDTTQGWSLNTNTAGNVPTDMLGLNYQGANSLITATSVAQPGLGDWGTSDDATQFIDAFFSLDVTPIPEPASAALIGIGALTMLGSRRRSMR